MLATAKAIAAPAQITGQDLLVAMEAIDTVASNVFKKLGLIPSAALGRNVPTHLCQDCELFIQDFTGTLGRDLQALASKEARSRNWSYLGTDGLLLALSRLGVSGVQLPYDRIAELIEGCLRQ